MANSYGVRGRKYLMAFCYLKIIHFWVVIVNSYGLFSAGPVGFYSWLIILWFIIFYLIQTRHLMQTLGAIYVEILKKKIKVFFLINWTKTLYNIWLLPPRCLLHLFFFCIVQEISVLQCYEQMEVISSLYEAPQMVWFAEAITHTAGPLISLAAFDYEMIQMPAKHTLLYSITGDCSEWKIIRWISHSSWVSQLICGTSTE